MLPVQRAKPWQPSPLLIFRWLVLMSFSAFQFPHLKLENRYEGIVIIDMGKIVQII